ncbi:MAG: AraC family transcriptional regulator [Verrucomicrobiae bacterium]|nr:AraC family transcriptional regulator [Verrucomicrobiae bacterium]
MKRGKTLPRYEIHPLSGACVFAFYDTALGAGPIYWNHHKEMELVYYPGASGIRAVGDSVEPYRNGDLCLIGPDVPHGWSIEAKPGRKERILQIQFDPGAWGPSLMELPEMKALKRLFQETRFGLKIAGESRRRIAQMLLEFAKKPPPPPQRFCTVLNLLVELAVGKDWTPLSSTIMAPAVSSPTDSVLGRVLDYIRENTEQGRAAPQPGAAAIAGKSPAAFSRFFKRHTGKTYEKFINEIRIGKACMALLQTERTISEIAYAAGFQNLSHFNTQFRAMKTLSPGEYRRRLQLQFGNKNRQAHGKIQMK